MSAAPPKTFAKNALKEKLRKSAMREKRAIREYS
jgi:hypothetical protein